MTKEEDEMTPQVLQHVESETEQEQAALSALLKGAGKVKTREVIDSQEICREVRGKA